MTPQAARWAILGAALAFSTGGAAIKGVALPGVEVAGLRSLIAAAVLLVAVPEARRGWRPRVVLVAAAYAAMMVTFVVSNKLTTAANAIFLQSTFPVVVLGLGPWLLGERWRWRDVGVLAVMGLGIALIAGAEDAPTATAPHPVLGNLVALAAGGCWGLTVIGLRWLARDGASGTGGGGAAAAAVLGNLLAAAATLVLPGAWIAPSATDVALLLWLGGVQVGLAYVLMTRALAHLDALDASVILLAEPAIAPVWAWAVHGEAPSTGALAGGGVIGLGLVVRAIGEARARRA